MHPPRVPALFALALAAACTEGTPGRSDQAGPEPATSEVVVRAVDAGTGEALVDSVVTVRYLARRPITLDASAAERVPSSEPYRIAHDVSEDSLVVEVRLEAPSYVRLDTVLAVARGSSAGPFTIRLEPRALDVGAGDPPARTGPPPEQPAPARTEPVDPPATPTDAWDRSGLRAGDRAFRSGRWEEAVQAYRGLRAPVSRTGDDAQEYQLALVRRGISHINLGDLNGALEALREAVAFDFREYTAYFYLGQVQCSLGQFESGRRTLSEINRLDFSISEAQRPIVLVLVDYQRAMCSYHEFRRARDRADVARSGNQAIQEFEDFIRRGEALSPVPQQVQNAVADARSRVQEIRGR